MHISKLEAETEAIRIAEAFVSSSYAETDRRSWECGEAKPDLIATGFKKRKVVIKWTVIARHTAQDGSPVDGDSIVLVNIETGEACWFGELA